ncbi:MAG TPA: 16S rRNA (adenine(1518)-N(6)/adenine(1519)-N(6))-dimethyltransferase RsmA [Acidimicrobiia bacterium]|nr:16S rRNA (adenine(1518)-N(6)/adenine(1519)-N(6))-dimethyltransferase RsmA [Acidimicrobiia bacterium]
MSAQTRSEIAGLLSRHGLTPTRHLGQHFLADANITRKIVALAQLDRNSKVVEIGAGTGTLTRALAATGARVISYEIDHGLRPVLEEVTAGFDVDLRFDDVTRVEFGSELEGEGWAMVANLPYNVGTPVVLESIRSAHNIDLFVVMMQREVALRFAAQRGDADYGLPSVVAGIYTDVSVAFTVPPQVFLPPPRVESAVVVMRRREAPERAERAVELARAGFGQRRKMLRGSLARVLDDPTGTLENAGIDPTSRAEDLTPTDYLRLAMVR